MKKIAILPISRNSDDIEDLNLLLVDGHPLASYVIKACKISRAFDEIRVIASEPLFEKLAQMHEVEIEKTTPVKVKAISRGDLTAICSLEDKQNYQSTCAVVIPPECPLVLPQTLETLVKQATSPGIKSVSTFEPKLGLGRIKAFNNAVAEGQKISLSISFTESLFVKTKEDLQLIESVLLHRRQHVRTGQFKFNEKISSIENELQGLISRDGVTSFAGQNLNVAQRNIDEIHKKMGSAPWLYFLFYTNTDQIALICQAPGEGARRHCHVTHDEWWVVIDGVFEWRLEGGKTITGKPGDIIFLPQGTIHHIVCVGEKDGLRLACGARDMEHLYYPED